MTDGTFQSPGAIPEPAQPGNPAPTTQAEARPASDHGAARPISSPSRDLAAIVFSSLGNFVGVAAIIYFTYFFTVYFSRKPPAPAPVPESILAAVKKTEVLRAEDARLLTTYGVVNPALKSVRIPVDRAMELIAAESARPPAAAAVAAVAAPTAGVAVGPAPTTGAKVAQPTTSPTAAPVAVASAATPAPAAAPGGLTPSVLYRAVCIACHDVDGRGGIVRKAMPVIPDFTDPKWQASRTDAELEHSILDGKGQLMLPMKDKLALARIDPKAMVAFLRRFQPGAPAVAAGTPSAPVTAQGAVASTAPKPTTPSGPTANPPASAASAAPPASAAAGASSAALDMATPLPPEALALLSPPPAAAPSPPSTPGGAAPSPEAAAKLRASADLFRTNCAVCHGPDGRGSLVRAAMPVIPDFTARAWQASHESAQLSISILEGKGTLMPPWRGKVTPDQAHDLAAYVRTFGPADLLASGVSPSEFGKRYRDLKKQWDDLDQQMRSLSRP